MRRVPQTIEAETLEQIRMNIAFEQMIVAVLAGAFVGGGLTLLLKLADVLIAVELSFNGLIGVFLDTLFVSFMIFLIGFFASVAVGAPLFTALEKRKRRNMWPYLAASMGVAIAAFIFIAGGLPAPKDATLARLSAIFIPAIVVAVVFARLMQPHWRAAAQRDARAEENLYRLH
ncbi:hypothetical protein [Hyphococcus sp.]|uniref:hypothetical protein n=1 Tax=Hyphococcus sp. TaxID=2038636 RepID=UPI003CCB8F8A